MPILMLFCLPGKANVTIDACQSLETDKSLLDEPSDEEPSVAIVHALRQRYWI